MKSREFNTGATRDTEAGKLRFHAGLSPFALEAYVDYLRRHNNQVHRCEENWKKGMPLDSFMGSGFRHFHHWWKCHEALPDIDPEETDFLLALEEQIEAICGVLFNAFGYLHELVKPEPREMLDQHLNSDK